MTATEPNQGDEPGQDLEPLAIVGMSCRLSGDVKTPEDLWEMCARRRSGWSEIPQSRFNAAAYYHPDAGRSGTFNPKGGHFIQQDPALFDAPFFNISLHEAKSLDPQQRMMLECAYEALENGGCVKDALQGKNVGVYVGASFADYELNNLRDSDNIPMYQTTGCAPSLLSNRISYFFDFKGPSITVDTACSSSLVAMHLACQSLRQNEASCALVGGCHLNLTPDFFVSMSMSRLFSDSGKSYSFDHRGSSGFGRGEGAGCIILKRLSSALAANDSIKAVIMHSGVNQDGRTQGITLPNAVAQEELMRSVYRAAKLDPRDTGYIEAHGTGTKAGDPLEAAALHAVFGEGRTKRAPLFLGSVKSNVGHTEGASGVIAVIKAAMMLDRGFILPDCDFEKAKEDIPLDDWDMKVPVRQLPWPRGKKWISVNNFGYGGTNAHIVLGRGPQVKTQVVMQQVSAPVDNISGEPSGPRRKLYVMSGNDEDAANNVVRNTGVYLERNPAVFDLTLLDNLAYTLGQRRSHMGWRYAVTADGSKDLVGQMSSTQSRPQKSFGKPVVGFVFTGQGAQWQAMGQELLATYPIFAESLARSDRHVASLGAAFSLFEEIYQTDRPSKIGQGHISQPACSAIQIALVDLLRSWGVFPTSVVGHSSGEVAAAYAAEYLTLEESMTIAYFRGIAVQQLAVEKPELRGAMVAVGAGETELLPMLRDLKAQKAVIACINSASSTTVSGDEDAIQELQVVLESKSIFAKRLHVNVAYHSHHMCMASDFYRSKIQSILPKPSHITFHSSVYGRKMEYSELGSEYWVRNLESRVEFVNGLGNLLIEGKSTKNEPINTLIEIGPHSALEGPVKQILKANSKDVRYLPSLRRNKDAIETLQTTAADLFMQGAGLQLETINFPIPNEKRKFTSLTNLPKYPWNHNTRYWHDTRLGNNYLHKKFARSDLIGNMYTESDDIEPRWRNIVKTDDFPWIRDHKVQGQNVYPMTGYLAMAIEAISQQSKQRSVIPIGFTLREITTGKALYVPDSTSIEMMITLRPQAEGTRVSSDVWSEFRVFSWTSNRGWDEHCRGLITVRTPAKANPVVEDLNQSALETIASFDALCDQKVDAATMYSIVDSKGVEYGPLFRGITDVRLGNKRTVLGFQVPDTQTCMPCQFESDYLIHPATLDTCIQAVWPLLDAEKKASNGLYLPAFLKSMTVSFTETLPPGKALRIHGQQEAVETSHGPVEHNIQVFAADDPSKALIEFEGLSMSPVRDSDDSATEQDVAKICYKQLLEPTFDLIDVEEYITAHTSATALAEEKQRVQMLEQASYFLIDKAYSELGDLDINTLKPHHQKFYTWMGEQLKIAKTGSGLPLQSLEWTTISKDARSAFIESVHAIGPQGQMICNMGAAIPQILRQEIEPLSVMIEDGLLERYYTTFDSFCRSYENAKMSIDMMAAQNPNMSILEIGAGTGGATQPLLETLGGGSTGGLARFNKWTYTDISSGFFEAATGKFSAWGDMLEYKILDISVEPAKQGFQEGTYDLLVACNVLHTTTRMKDTLDNARRLLKPGGKLLMIEETSRSLRQFIYGTLPGWWLGEEAFRQDGPTMTPKIWNNLLHDSGFSGVDVCVDDYPNSPEQQGSLIVATACEPSTKSEQEVVIVCPKDSTSFPTSCLIDSIASYSGKTPKLATLEDVDAKGKICIVLYEVLDSLLSNISPEMFNALQSLLTTASGVLWATRGTGASAAKSPGLALVTGLARSVRSESDLRFITLDLDNQENTSDEVAIKYISRILAKGFFRPSALNTGDMEYIVRNGLISVPRLIEDSELDKIINRDQHGAAPFPQPFNQANRALKMAVEQPGILDTIYFQDDDSVTSPLPGHHVEIAVQHVGLNFKDVMHAMGQLNSDRFGIECSGTITKCGSNVKDFAIGDRVCAMVEGCMATYARCPSTSVWKVPETMDMEAAATIPVVYCTAYYSLVDAGRLQAGESVLIHAAAGGVGQAAILLAQAIGANIFATVGSIEKKEFLVKNYNIKPENIFFSRDLSFAEGIKKATNGSGVDVVLNSLAGEALRATWECVAPFGRFVEIGKKDIKRNTKLEMAQFDLNVTFSSVDLTVILEKRPALMKRLLSDVFGMFERGHLRHLSPISSYSISNVEEAMHNLQSGRSMGKIVIAADGEAMVKATYRPNPNAMFRSDSTYVIIGGTGGLGREMTTWMAKNGASSIVLVSRSGGDKEKVDTLIHDLAKENVKVMVCKCDMSDKSAVKQTLESTLEGLPHVAGAIYGAMVLEDVLFEKMSYKQFNSVIKPKVDGVWNLHDALLEYDLDFFITLSSLAGMVGNRGQAAYSATSTFMNAFVTYRKSLALPCSTLDLAPILGIGYLAENVEKQQQVTSVFGDGGINKDEYLSLLGAAVRGELTSSCNDYCITGLDATEANKDAFWTSDPKFSILQQQLRNKSISLSGGTTSAAAEQPISEIIAQQTDMAGVAKVITEALIRKVSTMLMRPEADFAPTTSLVNYGLDSLVAIEFRNWISRELGAVLQILEILATDSVAELGNLIVTRTTLLMPQAVENSVPLGNAPAEVSTPA